MMSEEVKILERMRIKEKGNKNKLTLSRVSES